MTSTASHAVNHEFETVRLNDDLWLACMPDFNIEVFGPTENDALGALINRFSDVLMAMPDDERSEWFAANTTPAQYLAD